MSDDYSNYPISLNEQKATKEQNASLWTPRDCLIAALRELDDGTWNPSVVSIISLEKLENEDTKFSSYHAGGNRITIIGLLAQHLHKAVSN